MTEILLKTCICCVFTAELTKVKSIKCSNVGPSFHFQIFSLMFCSLSGPEHNREKIDTLDVCVCVTLDLQLILYMLCIFVQLIIDTLKYQQCTNTKYNLRATRKEQPLQTNREFKKRLLGVQIYAPIASDTPTKAGSYQCWRPSDVCLDDVFKCC